MGTLLTFPGRLLPLVPPAKESAAEVLLPASACKVVIPGEEPPALLPEPPPDGAVPDVPADVGLEGCADPQEKEAATRKTSAISENTWRGLQRITGPPDRLVKA